MVPCAQVLATNIVNHTTLGRRRTTLEVSVGYDADLEQARSLLLETVTTVDGVLERPPPEVWVEAFADSGIALAVRFWHAPDIATLWRVRSAGSSSSATLDRVRRGAGGAPMCVRRRSSATLVATRLTQPARRRGPHAH